MTTVDHPGSTPEAATDQAALTELPGGLPAIVYMLRLAFRYQPTLLWISLGITVLGALPDALFALWLGLLAHALSDPNQPDQTLLIIAGSGLAFSAVGGWVLRAGGERLNLRFRQRLAVSLETHVARLQATAAGVEQHERPEALDRLAMLREQVFTLDHIFLSIFGGLGVLLRLLIVMAVLATVGPVLLLLGVAAIPPVVVSARRGRMESTVWESMASRRRLARHLFVLGTEAASAKELRVANARRSVADARAVAWDEFVTPIERVRIRSALLQTAAWGVFAAAFVLSIRAVTDSTGTSRAADTLIVVAAGSRLTAYIAAAATQIDTWGFFIQGAQRLLWLERFVEARRQDADAPPPDRLERGIRLEHVSFTYPGSDRAVLLDADVDLPAGSVVAIVGENGAGKSTMVKLLAGLYQPTSGRITVDGVDLATIDPDRWRQRIAGAFQDFVRFEFVAQRTIGVGDLPLLDDQPAATGAAARAGATDVLERLDAGLDTQLGPTWPEGVDLSGGQWQKLALARGLLRDRPLLVMLDEPTSALDAETEHALFERFAEQARLAKEDGRVTLLVSHRFSTVRMADRIVVVSGSSIEESGTHDELMARGGTYAELFTIQASAYR
ncbi:MAG: ABC transporter ATP-binding protein [Acidimicrobiales bacterium]